MPSFHGTFQLPDCKPVLVVHHDGKLLTGAGILSLTIRSSVAVYSTAHSSGTGLHLHQTEVILELVEAYIHKSKYYSIAAVDPTSLPRNYSPSLVMMRKATGA